MGQVLITEGCPASLLSAVKSIYFNKLDSVILEQSFCPTPIEHSLLLIYDAPAQKRPFSRDFSNLHPLKAASGHSKLTELNTSHCDD